MDTKSIYPTVDEINALPSKVKRYIHDLEMRINQKGQALTVMHLREERDLLHQRVEELEARIALLGKRISRSPDRNGLNRAAYYPEVGLSSATDKVKKAAPFQTLVNRLVSPGFQSGARRNDRHRLHYSLRFSCRRMR